ncbi:hypothetical protein [Motilimonas pumila]|uniref:Uncharacterized protein n=1 Tax=Motilimonas pumila TaxID=2303987 RepID=A0A418Y9B4_9GAMM|nr:hypothetical protein [Motilimonas pumila]RJG36916.1 hypothetical protein D1Z90_20090 [Motilimonas pumila]
MEKIEFYILIVNLISGLAGAGIAHWKGRNKILWFIICAITILIGLFIILVLPKSKKSDEISDSEPKSRKGYISKFVYAAVIVAVVSVYTLNLEGKKSDIVSLAKAELISLCNSDKSCIEKIHVKFEQCIEENLSFTKTSKLGRDVKLDKASLQTCIDT